MKKFTVVLYEVSQLKSLPYIGIVISFQHEVYGETYYFRGFYENSLEEAYNKYKDFYPLAHFDAKCVAKCVIKEEAPSILYYEITEKQLLGLIKLEKLTGRL